MWDPSDEDYSNPGSVLAEGVAQLYQKLAENPEQYPRGLTVRILLGNYPTVANLTWGDQIWEAIDDMRHAGVPEMVNEELGWKLEIANYAGVYPHSHTKFVVVDGEYVMAAGFNYGYLHYPRNHPSGKGDDLVDLGMSVVGPVAQVSMSTFDDQWEGANQIHCSDLHPTDGSDWKSSCQELKGSVSHVPEVMKFRWRTRMTTPIRSTAPPISRKRMRAFGQLSRQRN